MRTLRDFKNPSLVRAMSEKVFALGRQIVKKLGRRLVLMEVCGTHTVSISRSGLRGLLNEVLELRSGPGCPVCVTGQADIDKLVQVARLKGVVIASFGDMLRVPGSGSSLEIERAAGADVRIIYSPMEAVRLAETHPQKQVVLAGVGFETTAPAVALSIKEASVRALKNFSVLSFHKTVPPVLKKLLKDRERYFDGLLLPGHVCAVIGRRPLDFIANKYGVPSAVAGFEPVNILAGIQLILGQIDNGKPEVANAYKHVAPESGNGLALDVLDKYFEPVSAMWRGLGKIAGSGLKIKKEYENYNADLRFPVYIPLVRDNKNCRCGEILKGKILPSQCPLFSNGCNPFHPVGPCMVSSEGSCAAYYQYEEKTGVCN